MRLSRNRFFRSFIPRLASILLFALAVSGCRVDVSDEEQAQLNDALSISGLHAKYSAAGASGITLDDPVQSELSGKSLETLVEVVKKWRDQNHISVSGVGIQGPNSYVSIDNL
jgi:hypothetical protein